MPALRNSRQELFARLIANSGMQTTKAFVAAGYSANPGNAYNLRHNPRVSARITELQLEATNKALVTKGWVQERLKANVERAMQAVPVLDSRGNPTGEWRYDGAVANKALELLGKELGMFKEIKDLNINLRDLTLEQVNQLLAQMDQVNQPLTIEHEPVRPGITGNNRSES